MLPSERKKNTLNILGKLREKGAPMTPFPGEQEASSLDQELDMFGDVLSGTDPELQEVAQGKTATKKKTRKGPANESATMPSQILGAP